MDPTSWLGLWELIRDLVGTGTTVLLTTHLEEADRLAARIAVIDRGLLIGEGTADELKDRVGGSVLEVRVAQPDRSAARLPPWLQPFAAHQPVTVVTDALRGLISASRCPP